MRFLVNICLAVLAGLGISQVSETLTQTPAFNADLRVANVYGEDSVLLVEAMYDYPEYLLQVAASYVRADLLPSADTEVAGEYASIETATARAERAVVLLEEAVTLDPANAMTWEMLAWARLMTGDAEAARAHLARSWERAPNNRGLAETRLSLVTALFDPGLGDLSIRPTALELERIRNDFAIIEARSRADGQFFAEGLGPLLLAQNGG